MPIAASASPEVESPAEELQVQPLAPNTDEEQRECSSPSNQQVVSSSRSASREPGTSPERSDCSEGSGEEANSSSPVNTLLRLLSATVQSKSKSRSPTDCRKVSRSASSPRRSTSKSASRKKQSRLVLVVPVQRVFFESYMK